MKQKIAVYVNTKTIILPFFIPGKDNQLYEQFKYKQFS